MENRQDSFNDTVSSLLERKVRNWLSGVIREMNRTSPVQQWLDSLPPEVFPEEAEEQNSIDQVKDETAEAVKDHKLDDKDQNKDPNLDIPSQQDGWKRKSIETELPSASNQPTVKKKLQRDFSIQSEGCSPKPKTPLLRDYSLQSDASGSSGSSVLNVLGARKVDAESVLLDMGFGPSEKQQKLQRIPDRFLVPSKLKGISTEKFIKDEQHSMRMHDCGVFGYRGLTGNPHVPPSTIVAKIMDCILKDDVCREQMIARARYSVPDIRSSVLNHALHKTNGSILNRNT